MTEKYNWSDRDISSRTLSEDAFIDDPALNRFLRWWFDQGKRPPSHACFDILDHIAYAPNLFLFEFLDTGEIIYRLHGEALTEIAGKNYKDITFKEGIADKELSELAGYLNFVRHQEKPTYCEGCLDFFGKKYIPFKSLDLPLTDDAGKVTHILGIMSFSL